MAILFFLTFLKIYVIINYKIKEENFMENLIIMDKMKKLVDILNYHRRLYDEGHP